MSWEEEYIQRGSRYMTELIDNIIRLREAGSATVIAIETNDPVREGQFIKAMIRYHMIRAKDNVSDKSNLVYLAMPGSELRVLNAGSISIDDIDTKDILEFFTSVSVTGNMEPTFQLQSKFPFATIINHLKSKIIPNITNSTIFLAEMFPDTVDGTARKALTELVRDTTFYQSHFGRNTVLIIMGPCIECIISKQAMERVSFYRITPSTIDERKQLIVRTIQANRDVPGIGELLAKVTKEDVDKAARAGGGLNLYHLMNAVNITLAVGKPLDTSLIWSYKRSILQSAGLQVEEARYSFKHVGGYDYLKEYIQKYVVAMLGNQDLAEEFGVGTAKGILLYGPPGTGKTHFAVALAGELGLPFVSLNIGDFVSKWYGESTRMLKEALNAINSMEQVVVFIDEIDSAFGKRGNINEHEETRRMIGVMLNWLSDPDRKAIVVAATNRPQDLDDALIRMGRFDVRVPVLLPDFNARREIIRIQATVIRRYPLEDVDLDWLARETWMWTGAEIANMVEMAGRMAVLEGSRRVTRDHFAEALKRVKVNIEKNRRMLEEYQTLVREYTNDLWIESKVIDMINNLVRERTMVTGPAGARRVVI